MSTTTWDHEGHGLNSFRRRSGVTSLLLGMMLALLFSTACGKKSEGTADSPGKPKKLAANIPADALVVEDITPGKRGGSLILGITGDPKTFNPPLSDDNSSTRVVGYMYEALYGYDVYAQHDEPGLAKSWEYKEDTREWFFHLRDGLKWSDGSPLTSDDVLFYTEIITDPNVPTTEGEFMKSAGKPFEFSAPDPLTFVAKIPEVDSFAIMSLGLIKALPRHKYGQALKDGKYAEILGTNTKPEDFVVSGPFKMKEFKSGEKVVLERNPNYYAYDVNGTQLPYVDELILLNVENFDALALRFQAGDTDMIEDILPTNLALVMDGADAGDYQMMDAGLHLGSTNFWFNQKPGGSYEDKEGKRVHWEPPTPDAPVPPEIKAANYKVYIDPMKRAWFDRVEFRRACSMASNRDVMVRTILFGQGAPVYGPVGEANKQWNNPNIPTYPYDIAKASALLDSIGFKDTNGDGIREDEKGNPIQFTINTNKENQVREKIGVLLKEDMRKIGFDVTLQVLDFNDILTRTNESYEYEACLLGLGAGTPPHPAMGRNVWLTTGRMHNWNPEQKTPATPWEAKVDELYHSLTRTFDLAEQNKIHDEMQVIWTENQPTIYLTCMKLQVGARNGLGNLKPTPLDPHLSHNVAELYWK